MQAVPRFQTLLISLIAICGANLSTSTSAQDKSLEDIQKEIKQTQAQLTVRQAEAMKLEAVLKQTELAISNTAKKLNQTQVAIENNAQEQVALNARKRQLETDKATQQDVLANQLKSAFMTGSYDYAKMVFNQQDAGQFERTLTYYQYLNKARQENITQLTELVTELDAVNVSLEEKKSQLLTLQQTQKDQQSALRSQNTKRQFTLTSLNQKIATDSARVAQLQASEKALLEAIEQAQREAEERAKREAEATTQLNGLTSMKGRLPKPTSGRLRKLFGSKREGQVRWKGILINGNEGAPVKSVHQGKVLFSDWLKGFGLVIVVDHGEGYMSLYGHNQALLKQAGDPVRAGETIGLVGQSGGQLTPSLYFEIRRKGKALNPVHWLVK